MHRVELSLAEQPEPTPPQVLYWYKRICFTGTKVQILTQAVPSSLVAERWKWREARIVVVCVGGMSRSGKSCKYHGMTVIERTL